MKGNLYLITNKINDKVYVGKTYNSVEERFKQHISESRKDRSVGRDLYDAMRYLGVENFQIKLLGVFEEGILEEKEMEYIKKYDSYKNGYNQTLGGDGKRYVQYTDEEIISSYKECGTVKKASKHLGICQEVISEVLHDNNIPPKGARKKIKCSNGLVFDSTIDGARWCIETGLSNGIITQTAKSISRVARGERKSFLQLIWEYI